LILCGGRVVHGLRLVIGALTLPTYVIWVKKFDTFSKMFQQYVTPSGNPP
jgi:hypothetical protein